MRLKQIQNSGDRKNKGIKTADTAKKTGESSSLPYST